jgi:hypothetical protein
LRVRPGGQAEFDDFHAGPAIPRLASSTTAPRTVPGTAQRGPLRCTGSGVDSGPRPEGRVWPAS